MQTKVNLIVKVNSKLLDEIAKVMERCDFGINGILAPITYRISFKTTTEVNADYLKGLKEVLTQGFDKDGYRLISMERVNENEEI